jgi:two-component sensor histidine kinase
LNAEIGAGKDLMRKFSLATRLALLVAGTTLPMILFAAGVVYLSHMHDRQAAFDRVLDTVRGIRLVLDAELQGITSGLEVLAASQSLARGDLEAFRASAEAFLSRFPEGAAISLATRDGRQLLNTGAAPGAPLPPRVNRASIEEVFRTGRPAYSSLFVGSVMNQRIISVSVPVVRNGTVVNELSFDPPLALFQNIIQQLRPSDDWTMSFFDRTGVNFARAPNPEQTVGQRASPTLYAHLFDQREAKVETVSLEGVPLLTAFTRSPLTGWTVAAGLSVASLTEPLWQALAITASVGLVMLVIGLAFALSMAAQIARGEALHALLVNELNHRVKNTLATVQSIAVQTFRRTPDPGEAMAKFEARLIALGRAHSVLSDGKWESADVRDIVKDGLEPFAARDGNRLRSGGGEVRVASRCTLMISMVLHELATNATKYGAWSNRTGTVTVDWAKIDRGNAEWLRLTWRETGGPPVQAPGRNGFGSRLIEQSLSGVGGTATVEYDPAGLVCILECPRE